MTREQAIKWLENLAEEMKQSNNRATSYPQFQVITRKVKEDGTLGEKEKTETFLTESEAKKYLLQNKHSLTNPYLYIASGHRNEEYIYLRKALLALIGKKDF